jgi:hypothetical protein
MSSDYNMMLIRHFLSEGRYEDAFALAAAPGMCLKRGRLHRNVLGEAIAKYVPLWVIDRILTMCPEAAQNVDADGLTPLHQAINSGREDQTDLVKLLLPAFPGAAAIKDRNDLLPIFTSVTKYPDLETFHLLCDAHPAGLSEMDDCGRTLLHYAVLRSLDISKAILDRYPDAASETDGAGWKPIHMFCDSVGLLPEKSREIFWLLHNAYPDAIHAPLDEIEDGTIVHLAVQNWLLPEDITGFLKKELPAAAAKLAGMGKDGLPFVPNQFAF